MTRSELIAALEKATGPSEELDLAVATWCFENGAIGGVNYDPQLWLLRNEGFVYSIDAALTLVPEGLGWGIPFGPVKSHDGTVERTWWQAEVGDAVADEAATPALALCIAALRAMEAPHDGQG